MFGLDSEDAAKLNLSVSFDGDTATVGSSLGQVFEVGHRMGDCDLRDASKYDLSFCLTGFHGEAQVARVQTRGEHTPLGYVMPITAFRSDAGLGDEWTKRFAHVAFRKLISLENFERYAAWKAFDSLRGKRLFPDEVFPDDLSLLILGKLNLEKAAISQSYLDLMLLDHGITRVGNAGWGKRPINLAKFSKNISVRSMSQVIKDDISVIYSVISSSDDDRSEVGRFIRLYQIMEYCLEAVYSWGLSSLLKAGFSSWKLKKKLGELTGERYRLGVLVSHCLSKPLSSSPFDLLAEECRNFLTALSEDADDQSWQKLLYAVRNVVVHDQIRMLRAVNVPLTSINRHLRQVCFEVIANLKEPDLSEVWRDDKLQESTASPEVKA